MICGLPPLRRKFGVVVSLTRKRAWAERFICDLKLMSSRVLLKKEEEDEHKSRRVGSGRLVSCFRVACSSLLLNEFNLNFFPGCVWKGKVNFIPAAARILVAPCMACENHQNLIFV